MPARRLKLVRTVQHRREYISDSEEAEDVGDVELKPSSGLKPNGAIALLLLFLASVAGHHYPLLWMPRRLPVIIPDLPEQALEASRASADDARAERELLHGTTQAQAADGVLSQPQSTPSGGLTLRAGSQALKPTEPSDDWQSVFVRDVTIRMQDEQACVGVIPAKFHPAEQPEHEPIESLEDLLRPKQRVLAFLPRHGLGNSLRSYVSAYVYALLSGRILVRLHAAEHAKVYDLLCESFDCGFDAIRWKNKSGSLPMELYRKFGVMKPFYFLEMYKKNSDIAASIYSEYPVFATRSGSHFDMYWHRKDNLRGCVYAAFKCSSLWCVHSRAMYALVGRGGPSKALDNVMFRILKRHEPSSQASLKFPLAPVPTGKRAVFDVALHLRTRTLKVEKAVRKDTERYSESECQDSPEDGETSTEERPKFLRKCLWECVNVILSTLHANLASTLARGSQRGLTILLATDDADSRPEFVKRLEQHGTVFYSTGTIMHTSKAGGDMMTRLPTMAEFFFMVKAHTTIEAGSYISTFAYFSSLVGNGTLAGISMKGGACKLKLEHKASLI